MGTKHTSGQWEVSLSPSSSIRIMTDPRNPMKASVICSISGSGRDEEIQANAKLIAAAPELLEFVQNMNTIASLRENGAQYDDVMIIQWTKELIEKATAQS